MEQFFRVGISVNGIKKRCRKSDSHYFHAGYIPYNNGDFNKEEIENLAKGLIETNMKTLKSKVHVILNHVKVADGIETWEMFGKTNVKFELNSSLENALQ
jgi:hypothetical protein